jgi:WD40 repeat protein
VHSVLALADNMVISGGDDGVVRVSQNKISAENVPEISAQESSATPARVVGEGEALVEVVRDNKEAGLYSFNQHTDYVRGLSVRPQSTMVCSASWDGSVGVFDYSKAPLA